MVAVQAVAGSIINKAIRVLHQKMTKVVKMEWEDTLAAFGKLSDIPETALHINRGEMELSAIPKPALYIKRGKMEKDLALCTKKRERRERKKKTSRKAEASEWDIEAAWVEFINDNGPYELLDTVAKVRQPWFNVGRSGLRPQA